MSRLATNFRKLQTVHWRQIRWKINLQAADSECERKRTRVIRSISTVEEYEREGCSLVIKLE